MWDTLTVQVPTDVSFEELKEIIITLSPDPIAAAYACNVGQPSSTIGKKYIREVLSQSYQKLLRKNPRIYYQNIYLMGYIAIGN